MNNASKKVKKRNGIPLFLSIILVFCVLGTVVFAVSKKISQEMSNSAIQNLSESLDLIQCTIEAILKNEAEFQQMIAHEISKAEDPMAYIRAYEQNQTMVKLSLVLTGETSGLSNTGASFSPKDLDFSSGATVDDLPVSQSYLNDMGTWAYTLKCPVEKAGREIATLYVEYIYDSLDKSLPDGFYDQKAMLYIMDARRSASSSSPKAWAPEPQAISTWGTSTGPTTSGGRPCGQKSTPA